MKPSVFRKWFVIAIAIAVIAAACGDDDGGDTTSPGGTAVATTTVPVHTDLVIDEVHSCLVDDLLFLAGPGVVPDDAVVFEDYAGRYGGEVDAPSEFGVWEATGLTALEAVNAMRLQGETEVWPLYLFAQEGHWSLEPGADAPVIVSVDPGFRVPNDSTRGRGFRVVVIDSGFNVVSDVGIDTGDNGEVTAGSDLLHGDFVSQLISMVAPAATIEEHSVTIGTQTGLPDDITVRDALRKALALESTAAFSQPTVINLSMGTYACESGVGPVPPKLTESALTKAQAKGAGAIAAGGNDVIAADGQYPPTFFPAAFPEQGKSVPQVLGVGSRDLTGADRLWEDGVPVAATGPSWEVAVPGVDLVSGFFEFDTVALKWSGSSFATAVFTGLLAAGCGVPASLQDVVSYDTIPGLVYWTDLDGVVAPNPTLCP